MQDAVVEITHQARRSPDVNQASGVSVRMSISNYETIVANAVNREDAKLRDDVTVFALRR